MFLKLDDVWKAYRTGDVEFQVLKQVGLELDQGEIGVILGPSGSGKSTLLNIIGGVDRPSQGKVWVAGQDIAAFQDEQLTEYRRNQIGFVFQFYNLIPTLTVFENVELAVAISQSPLPIRDVLKAVGLDAFQRHFPGELSGGQQQRTAIARALVKNPELLLCDEPTGALDYETSKEILQLLDQVNRDFRTTIAIITHNEVIAQMADCIYRMRSGEIIDVQRGQERMAAVRLEW